MAWVKKVIFFLLSEQQQQKIKGRQEFVALVSSRLSSTISFIACCVLLEAKVNNNCLIFESVPLRMFSYGIITWGMCARKGIWRSETNTTLGNLDHLQVTKRENGIQTCCHDLKWCQICWVSEWVIGPFFHEQRPMF